MQKLKPIETRYKGYRFRSRLEARWAVFFDSLNVQWEYEKEGFELDSGRYLPDFWFIKQKCWVEIKPCSPSDRELILCEELVMSTRSPAIIVAGSPGDERLLFCYGPGLWNKDERCGGMFSPHWTIGSDDNLRICRGEFPCSEDRRLKDAVEDARAARFEFGESGSR